MSAEPGTPHHPARSGRSRLARRLALAALLLGILGMHALGTHGTTHEPASGGHHVGAATHAAATVVTAPDADGGHGTGSMMVLCLVVLAGATLLLGARAGRRGTGWKPGRVASPRTPVVAFVPRSSRPPPAWRFSVLRC